MTAATKLSPRVRKGLLAVALAGLFAAPAAWAGETLGHATSSTFPAGGAASAGGFGGPGGGPGGFGGPAAAPGRPGGLWASVVPPASPGQSGVGLPGAPAPPAPEPARPELVVDRPQRVAQPVRPAVRCGGRRTRAVSVGPAASAATAPRSRPPSATPTAHGGGAIGVSSQSSAAAAILTSNADVAGLGGFSGRESSVTAAWIAMEVSDGRLRWVINDANQGFRAQGDTRTGQPDRDERRHPSVSGGDDRQHEHADRARATVPPPGSVKMYDCQGRAAAILAAAKS